MCAPDNVAVVRDAIQHSPYHSVAASVVWWLACWPLVPKFAGSNPAEAIGFFGRKKSSACLPSEGK